MKKLMKYAGMITITLTAIGVAVRAIKQETGKAPLQIWRDGTLRPTKTAVETTAPKIKLREGTLVL